MEQKENKNPPKNFLKRFMWRIENDKKTLVFFVSLFYVVCFIFAVIAVNVSGEDEKMHRDSSSCFLGAFLCAISLVGAKNAYIKPPFIKFFYHNSLKTFFHGIGKPKIYHHICWFIFYFGLYTLIYNAIVLITYYKG